MTFGDCIWALLACTVPARRNDVARCVAVAQFQSPASFILDWDFTVLLTLV